MIVRYQRHRAEHRVSAGSLRRRASILVGLLWCLALLSVIVIGILHTATLDLRVVKNYGDQVQAHYLALAGIERAKALLYQEAADRKRSAQNHSGRLYDSPQDFRDVPFGRGQYRIFHQAHSDDGGRLQYGISDEESRLNVNSASAEEMGKLYQMRPEIAAAIVDYRDEDNAVTPGGAEAEYYASLQPPYLPRNGPFQSKRELLMVRGVSRDLLGGEDANLNGLLDREEDDGNESYPSDNHDGILDAGWSENITVNSSVRNVNAAGQDRVNVQSADESALTGVPGIKADVAKAIVAYRNQNRLESLADLLDVRAMTQGNQATPPPNPTPNQARPAGGASGQRPANQAAQTAATPQPTGPTLISEDLLMEIADDLTTVDEQTQVGAINVNTASVAVLACLPRVDHQLAQAIVSYRKSAGYLPNVAWLLKVPGMTRDIFKQVASKVTVRSETFRIFSEGKVKSTGARKRIEAIVRLGAYSVDTVSYREDL